MKKLEYALFKTDKTPSVFDAINKRFTSIDVRHVESRQELVNEIDEIRHFTRDFKFLVKTNEEKISNLDTKIETFR